MTNTIKFKDYFPSGPATTTASSGSDFPFDNIDFGDLINGNSIYSPATLVIAPQNSGYKADYYTDGVNDDVEINAAIIAANALSLGGKILLKSGVYTIGASINLLSNVWLSGEGMFKTRISINPGVAFTMLQVSRTTYNSGNPYTNGTVSDLEIDASNMLSSSNHKCLDGLTAVNCKFERIYAHDSTATGLGLDDFSNSTITDCIVANCGYTNPLTITAASWTSPNILTFTTATPHGYSVGHSITVTGMTPIIYNGQFAVTTIVNSTTFTLDTSNNSSAVNLTIDPGTATGFGRVSDTLPGCSGIGIASGYLNTEGLIITNNIVIGSQRHNFFIEANYQNTSTNASYIFSNNISVAAGQCGYRNTGTINTFFTNNYDFGSPTGAEAVPLLLFTALTITAASWSAGVGTFTTSTAHGLSVGDKIFTSSMTPTTWDVYATVQSTPTTTTFTVNIASDPGTATGFGTLQKVRNPVDGTTMSGNVFVSNTSRGINVPIHADGVLVKNNSVKDSYNYGILVTASYAQITGNRVSNSGRHGIYLNPTGTQPITNIDISHNQVWNSAKRLTAQDAIYIGTTSLTPVENLTINNNQLFDNQDTPTQRYGLTLTGNGPLTNVVVSDNIFLNNTTAPILIQNTGDTIYVNNNIGVNPMGKSDLGNISGTVTFDSSLASTFVATLTGDITAVMPSNAVSGTRMTWILKQDSAGGHALTLPGNVTVSGDSLKLSTQTSVVDVITWIFDLPSNKWREVSRGLHAPLAVANGGTGTATGRLLDTNGNILLDNTPVASAVDYFVVQNGKSGSSPIFSVAGGSSTINYVFKSKGGGGFFVRPGSDNTSAFNVQNAGASVTTIAADTTNNRVAIGGTVPTATLDVRGSTTVAGNLTLNTAGNKLLITTGSNASAGTGTLSGGTVTISTTAVTANSLIFLTDTASTLTNVGTLSVSSKSAGVSFTVTSSNVLDTSSFNWFIIN